MNFRGERRPTDSHAHPYVAAVRHAETTVFDGRDAIVGSPNLDRQSLLHNYEVNLVTVDGRIAKEIDRLSEADLGRCEELSLQGLARPGRLTKAPDRLAAAGVQGFV